MNEYRPAPALLTAVTEALQTLARHYGRQMPLVHDTSDVGRAYVNDFAKAMIGVEFATIPIAADRWLQQAEKFPPLPGVLAKLARDVDRERRPATPYKFEAPPAVSSTRNNGLADRAMRSIRSRVNSWVEAAEVWNQIMTTAGHEEQRQAWSDGHVPPYIVDEAVAKFLADKSAAAEKRAAATLPEVYDAIAL